MNQEALQLICTIVPIRSYRNHIRSRSQLAARSPSYPRVKVDFALTSEDLISTPPDRPLGVDLGPYENGKQAGKIIYHTPEEEISMAPACWLWDYLRFIAWNLGY